jgi:hypothetical protein
MNPQPDLSQDVGAASSKVRREELVYGQRPALPEHVAGPVCSYPAAKCLLLLPGYNAPHPTLAALHPVVTRMLLSMQTQPGQQLVEGGTAQKFCKQRTEHSSSATQL